MDMNNSHKVKELILETFFKLLKERPFHEEVTINDVVEESGVARSSFYRYFNEIYDIVNYFFSKVYVEYDASFPLSYKEHIKKLSESFKLIKDDKEKFYLLFKTGYFLTFESYITDCMRNSIGYEVGQVNELHIRLVCYAYMSTLTRFMNDKFRADPKSLETEFVGIINLNTSSDFIVEKKSLPILSVENMRKSDAFTIENFTPSEELMFRAGVGVYKSANWRGKIAIVCGKGNNAGDGYVLAMLLKNEENADVTLFLVEERFSIDGKHFFDAAINVGVPYKVIDDDTDFKDYDIVVDALLGTGFKGEPKGNIKTAIEKINESNAYIISIDINSGLNGDNGLASLAVYSNLTVSIGSYKPSHFLNMAKDYIDEKINFDIGIVPLGTPYYLLGSDEVKKTLKKRKNMSNKGDFGYIALIGGSKLYSGAIRLSNLANSTLKAGGGVTLLATPKSISDYIIPNILESTIYPLDDENGFIKFNKDQLDYLIKRCKTIAIGMGMGLVDETIKVVDYLLENYSGNLIIDADGLNALSKLGIDKLDKTNAKVILTPHIKEFSRLTNKNIEELQENPIENALNFASNHKCIVLLKGPTTVVSDGKKVYLVDRGCPGMATAGSGDVLSGIIAGIVSINQEDLLLATASAAYINGLAGEISALENDEISMLASDTASHIGKAIKIIKTK